MQLNSTIESYKADIIENTSKLIQIPSVETTALPGKPFGEGINEALLFCLKLAEELGFKTGNVDGFAGYAEMGAGEQTLAILVHLDVVPEGTGWTYPPFSGEVHDGKIFGRGAIDDKGPAIAALYAMKAVKDCGIGLSKKVRLIFGLDEESGWKDMEYYFKKEPMPEMGITPDGCYPVIYAEKGIVDAAIKKSFKPSNSATLRLSGIAGGERSNMVPDSCECTFKPHGLNEKVLASTEAFFAITGERLQTSFKEDGALTIKASGISAHGSTPEKGKNAIAIMLSFLSSLGFGESDMERYLSLINDEIGFDTKGYELGIASEDESGELTVNLGTLVVNADGGTAVMNIRYPVSLEEDVILKKIKEAFSGEDVEVSVRGGHKPLYVPKDHPLVKTLLEVYKDQTGQSADALAIGGGTYARALENGVAFGAMFPGKPELAHQKDEYIEIEDLMLNAKIYAHAIAKLCV
jgi:succinyl-diaminopimelate desuccinylase